MNKNILGTISICKKASKIECGADVVRTSIEDNRARLILYSNDCSPKTLKPIEGLAKTRGVVVLKTPHTSQELGTACGKAMCAVLAITDIGLAVSIGKKLADSSKENEEASKTLDLKLKRKIERGNNKTPRAKKPKINIQQGDDFKKGEKSLNAEDKTENMGV